MWLIYLVRKEWLLLIQYLITYKSILTTWSNLKWSSTKNSYFYYTVEPLISDLNITDLMICKFVPLKSVLSIVSNLENCAQTNDSCIRDCCIQHSNAWRNCYLQFLGSYFVAQLMPRHAALDCECSRRRLTRPLLTLPRHACHCRVCFIYTFFYWYRWCTTPADVHHLLLLRPAKASSTHVLLLTRVHLCLFGFTVFFSVHCVLWRPGRLRRYQATIDYVASRVWIFCGGVTTQDVRG